jgi:hypothetical protein
MAGAAEGISFRKNIDSKKNCDILDTYEINKLTLNTNVRFRVRHDVALMSCFPLRKPSVLPDESRGMNKELP